MLLIINASPRDGEVLQSIYAPYVTQTAVTFEHTAPTVQEFTRRIETIQNGGYPYLKAVEDGTVLGYAYAAPFKNRAGYAHSVETTIYLRPEARRQGIGRHLYRALEEALEAMGIQNMNACIALPVEEPDPYLTNASPMFHQKCGFSMVGIFHQCAYKFDRYYNMCWMEKLLTSHSEPPKVQV